jgi:hypothetical protein
MPFRFATRGLYTFMNTAVSGSTDIRCGVLTNAGTLTDAQIRDTNFVSDLLALSGIVEAANTNYARQDLAGVTLTEVDANDNVTLVATAPTMTNVAAGSTWRNVFYYVEGGGTDATRVMIGVDTPAATITPNGGNITLPALSITVGDTSA